MACIINTEMCKIIQSDDFQNQNLIEIMFSRLHYSFILSSCYKGVKRIYMIIYQSLSSITNILSRFTNSAIIKFIS